MGTCPVRSRYLVAPDSFKGTFDAAAVAAAIGRGVEEAGAEADLCPIADGGEGTAAALLAKLGGRTVEAEAHDPLRRPIVASFALLAGGRTAVVEVAAASGLPLLAEDERDAEAADSFGTGELIAAAIAAGARKVLVAAGGIGLHRRRPRRDRGARRPARPRRRRARSPLRRRDHI